MDRVQAFANEAVEQAVEAVVVVEEAVVTAGAPRNSVQSVTRTQAEHLDAIMKHSTPTLTLATGTRRIVRPAQLSGTPTLGVGPGTVPVSVHTSADLPLDAKTIAHSKTFDNGTVRANDQAVVADFARMEASRVLVNTPTTEGALGGFHNHPPPSLPPPSGTSADNMTTDNITIDHLWNIHRVARTRPNRRWLEVLRDAWMDPEVDGTGIPALYDRNC